MDNVVQETHVQTEAAVISTEVVGMDPKTVEREIALQIVCTSGLPASPSQSIESDHSTGGATALCGKDSAGGKVRCPLDVCCSYYGYCGVSSFFVMAVGII